MKKIIAIFLLFAGFVVALAEDLCFEGKEWSVRVARNSGAIRSIEYGGKRVIENPSGEASFYMPTPRLEPQTLEKAEFDQTTGTLDIHLKCGLWKFNDLFFLNDERLIREFYLTYKGQKAEKFKQVDVYYYLPKTGTFFLPSLFFNDDRNVQDIAAQPRHEVPCRGNMADIAPQKTLLSNPSSCFAFFMQTPGKTLMLGTDDTIEFTRIMLRARNNSIRAVIYNRAAGWADPDKKQLIARNTLEVCDGTPDEALMVAPQRWFRDFKQLPPADRPQWCKDMIMIIGTPNFFYGNCRTTREAEKYWLPYISKRGYNTMWFMPLQEPFSYMPGDFRSLRGEFGVKEDVVNFIQGAHRLDIKVLLDIIPHGGYAREAPLRGLSPWTLAINEEGKFVNAMSYDYGHKEYRDYFADVCRFYLSTYPFDGFKADQCGSTPENWRHPDFPSAMPANCPDEKWWNDAVAKNGGKIPPIEMERASCGRRQAGILMVDSIRKATREYGSEKLLIAEDTMITMPIHGDVGFIYFPMPLMKKLPVLDGQTFAKRYKAWHHEMLCTDPPDSIRHMSLDGHSRGNMLDGLGLKAYLALRSSLTWFPWTIMDNFTGTIGAGVEITKLNRLRWNLEELRRGTSSHVAVKTSPEAYSIIRSMPKKAALCLTSFMNEDTSFDVTLDTDKLGFSPNDIVNVHDAFSGELLKNGKVSEMSHFRVTLPGFGYTALVFRPPGSDYTPPLQALSYEQKPVEAPQASSENIILNGLCISRKTGLPASYCGILTGGDILTDAPSPPQTAKVARLPDGSVKAELSCGMIITYAGEKEGVKLTAELASFADNERTALVFSAGGTRRWRVNECNGIRDDWHDPDFVDDTLEANYWSFKHRARSAVIYDSYHNPLFPDDARISLIGKDGNGIDLRLEDPFSKTFDNIMLLNSLPGRNELQIAFFLVQPGALSLAEKGKSRRLVLHIAPAAPMTYSNSFTTGGIEVVNNSYDWKATNRDYEITLSRMGGSVLKLDCKKTQKTVFTELDIKATTGSKNLLATQDRETSLRIYVKDGILTMRFAGALGGAGAIRPAIWFMNEFLLRESGPIIYSSSIHGDFMPASNEMPALSMEYNSGTSSRVIPLPEVYKEGWTTLVQTLGTDGITPSNSMSYTYPRLKEGLFWKIHSWATGDTLPAMLQDLGPGKNYFVQINANAMLYNTGSEKGLEVWMPCELGKLEQPFNLKPGLSEVVFRYAYENVKKDDICNKTPFVFRLQYRLAGEIVRVDMNQPLPDGTSDGYQQLKKKVTIPDGAEDGVIVSAFYLGYGQGKVKIVAPELVPIND